MKNNIKTLTLSSIVIVETLILLLVCFYKFSNNKKTAKANDVSNELIFLNNIKITASGDNSYVLNFLKNQDTFVFVKMSDKGFDSMTFRDNSNNQGAISFDKEIGGYFSIYDAGLGYVMDNRLSQDEDFKFQRIECFGEKSYCYDIKYDDDIVIKKKPLPAVDYSDSYN